MHRAPWSPQFYRNPSGPISSRHQSIVEWPPHWYQRLGSSRPIGHHRTYFFDAFNSNHTLLYCIYGTETDQVDDPIKNESKDDFEYRIGELNRENQRIIRKEIHSFLADFLPCFPPEAFHPKERKIGNRNRAAWRRMVSVFLTDGRSDSGEVCLFYYSNKWELRLFTITIPVTNHHHRPCRYVWG